MRDRLLRVIESARLNKKDFAEAIGIAPSSLSEFFNGHSKALSSETLTSIAGKFNVNLNWLLTGEGAMFMCADSVSDVPTKETILPAPQLVIPSDDEFIPLYKALPTDDQKEVRAFTGWRAVLRGVSVSGKSSKAKESSTAYKGKIIDLTTTMEVPLLGQIAAGNPIFASDNVEQILRLPQGVAKPKGRRLFALRVRGESMIGAGIHNGDFALLREVVSPLDEVASGDIVAAVIGTDATLKRVFFEDHSIILKAENPAFEPIVCESSDRCQVVGALVMTWRWWEKG